MGAVFRLLLLLAVLLCSVLAALVYREKSFIHSHSVQQPDNVVVGQLQEELRLVYLQTNASVVHQQALHKQIRQLQIQQNETSLLLQQSQEQVELLHGQLEQAHSNATQLASLQTQVVLLQTELITMQERLDSNQHSVNVEPVDVVHVIDPFIASIAFMLSSWLLLQTRTSVLANAPLLVILLLFGWIDNCLRESSYPTWAGPVCQRITVLQSTIVDMAQHNIDQIDTLSQQHLASIISKFTSINALWKVISVETIRIALLYCVLGWMLIWLLHFCKRNKLGLVVAVLHCFSPILSVPFVVSVLSMNKPLLSTTNVKEDIVASAHKDSIVEETGSAKSCIDTEDPPVADLIEDDTTHDAVAGHIDTNNEHLLHEDIVNEDDDVYQVVYQNQTRSSSSNTSESRSRVSSFTQVESGYLQQLELDHKQELESAKLQRQLDSSKVQDNKTVTVVSAVQLSPSRKNAFDNTLLMP